MATFITVVREGDGITPYLAVQACQHKDPLYSYNYYNSRLNQSFPWSETDQQLSSKQITDIKSGKKMTAKVFQLSSDYKIDDEILVPGCNSVSALGFTSEVARYIDEWNALGKEKVKIVKQKNKLKNS